MKLYQKYLEIRTRKLYDFINITQRVEEIVKESGIRNGLVFVKSTHNTATVFLQEDDPSIFEDMKELFERILPLNGSYKHAYEGNENATAHLKSNLLGSCVCVPIVNGELELGGWQQVIFVELFKAMRRKVIVTVIGE